MAFCQGVRDEKMLEKLATHDMETISTLFTLADKCARAIEGRAWHSAPQAGDAQTGGSGTVAHDSKKNNNRGRGRQMSERKSPAGWRNAPALNPKMRRGLSVLPVTRLGDEHTRTRKHPGRQGPPLVRCPQPGSCCATLLAPRPRWGP
jgi:hypothetical protein